VSDLVSICEAYVARSVGMEGVAATVGGASSAAGSGRGPRQTNVLFKDVFDTTLYSICPAPRLCIVWSGLGRALVATWSFYGCYFTACWACLVFKGVFRACLNVTRPHALLKGACCTTLHEGAYNYGFDMTSSSTRASSRDTILPGI